MNPDSVIAGLRKELAEVRPEETERRKSIEEQIAYADSQPRPEIKPESSDTVAQPTRVYYDALKQEFERAPEGRQEEIQAEITRVEAQLAAQGEAGETEAPADVEPTVEVDDGKIESEQPTDDLAELSRRDLNERAASLGVPEPDQLPNKDAVIQAIQEHGATGE